MKLYEIIQRCVGIEQMIAEVYRALAARWTEPALEQFWAELANEEVFHGIALGEVVRLPAADREDAAIDPLRLAAIHDRVEGCFPVEKLTLDQALELTLELEELELDNIYRRLHAVTTDDSRMSNAFKTAMGSIGKHEKRVLDMIDARAEAPPLRARAAARRERLLRTGQ